MFRIFVKLVDGENFDNNEFNEMMLLLGSGLPASTVSMWFENNYLSNDLNTRRNPIYLRVKLMDKRNFKYINSISINLKNMLDINKFKIIDKFENCYYVSK